MRYILGIIPARGGSKGIPNKNIFPLKGRPLIAYTIEAAKGSHLLDDFFVSTDAEVIAKVARAKSAQVPFIRPNEIAKDDTPMVSVLQHAIKWYEEKHRINMTAVVTLQPTAPLRLASDIDGAISLFLRNPEADSLITCYNALNVHPNYMYVREGGRMITLMKERSMLRRQEFEPVYVRNGAVYITRRDLIMEGGRIVGDKPLGYIMPRERSVNIDEPFDLELALFLLNRKSDDKRWGP